MGVDSGVNQIKLFIQTNNLYLLFCNYSCLVSSIHKFPRYSYTQGMQLIQRIVSDMN